MQFAKNKSLLIYDFDLFQLLPNICTSISARHLPVVYLHEVVAVS